MITHALSVMLGLYFYAAASLDRQCYDNRLYSAVYRPALLRYVFYTAIVKKKMLEQQLINAFMKLTAKAGAGDLVRNLIHHVDENGNPKVWTATEMQSAIHFINAHVENFGKGEAIAVVQTLMRKFDIHTEELQSHSEPLPDTPGVQGLQ
jgi:uncharacterized protein YktA (UPF0223 family)